MFNHFVCIMVTKYWSLDVITYETVQIFHRVPVFCIISWLFKLVEHDGIISFKPDYVLQNKK